MTGGAQKGNSVRRTHVYRTPRLALTLPPSVAHMHARPLYQIVAQWGLLLGRSFSTAEVRTAFGLSAQQTCDVLHYVYTEASGVVCEREMTVSRFGRDVVRQWRILAASEVPSVPRSDRPVPVKKNARDEALLRALREQLSGEGGE